MKGPFFRRLKKAQQPRLDKRHIADTMRSIPGGLSTNEGNSKRPGRSVDGSPRSRLPPTQVRAQQSEEPAVKPGRSKASSASTRKTAPPRPKPKSREAHVAQALSLPRRHSCRRPPGHDPDSHPETSKPASQVHVASPPTAPVTRNTRITHANPNFLQPAPPASSPQAIENKNTIRYP